MLLPTLLLLSPHSKQPLAINIVLGRVDSLLFVEGMLPVVHLLHMLLAYDSTLIVQLIYQLNLVVLLIFQLLHDVLELEGGARHGYFSSVDLKLIFCQLLASELSQYFDLFLSSSNFILIEILLACVSAKA